MQLTARDWSDLRWAAIVLIVCGAIDWLLMRRFQRKKAQPSFWMRALDPWSVPFAIWLFALGPMLERRGLPGWLSVTLLLATFLTALSSIFRKPRPGRNPQILISKQERKLTLYLTLAVVAGIVIGGETINYSLVIWARHTAGQPLETGKLVIAVGTAALTFFTFVYWKFGRWPGKVSCRATIDIAAAPDRVWDALALRDDYPGWKRLYTRIERLDEPGEVYRIHWAKDSQCGRCLLPRQPDRSLWSSRIEVVEARRPCLYRLRSSSTGILHRGDTAQWEDYEEVTYRLQPLAGGGTRLTFIDAAIRPKVWLAILSILSGPAKENVRSLKAHLEGSSDESRFGVYAKRIEAARNAPQHCACDAA